MYRAGVVFLAPLLLLPSSPPAEGPHEKLNPLYRELRTQGLPPPTLPDGLGAKDQAAVLKAVAEGRFPVAEFVRNAIAAPQVLNIGELESRGGLRLRRLGLWFVAYGDLKALRGNTEKEKLEPSLGPRTQLRLLRPEELTRRKIPPDAAAGENLRYNHSVFDVLDRVRVGATLRTRWSSTDTSVLVAGTIDPRFEGDAEFPNTWQSLELRSGEPPRLGPARPYRLLRYYLQVNQLAEPRGALFVEYHVLFEQPPEWFHGADLLRSRLPLAMQTGVRSFREELKREAARGRSGR